jgi:hypothetical protein
MYHGHASSQRGDGVLGSLIVRKKHDIEDHLYDKDLKEHVMVLFDWYALKKFILLLYSLLNFILIGLFFKGLTICYHPINLQNGYMLMGMIH